MHTRNHLQPSRTLRVVALLLLVAWIFASAAHTRADETRRRLRLPILMYHYVSAPPDDADKYRLDLSVTPDHFAAQLAWLRDNGYRTVSLDDAYAALARGRPLPSKAVVLTFDDGYEDAYEHAFPLLRQFGMTGTFFVVTEWIDEGRPGYLTWAQAREMVAAGMSIQSHSLSHPDLANGCDYDCLVYQILGSVETIQAETGVRPRFFCYPSGRYDDAVMQVAAQVGIVAAVTTQGGTLHTSDRLMELKRVRIRGTTSVNAFAWLVSEWRGESTASGE
ncbi:polysaccharide deacetylase family protein [Aggregatilinea lenta]|uniref:polysaccharide deacetylase family protein n=1 Tax=Aggregatilinea lenta TaxID=913108 RepID=UPI000E5C23DE|nr:polysaccharide deacetylase family protein [Aggregatilinea lenta]